MNAKTKIDKKVQSLKQDEEIIPRLDIKDKIKQLKQDLLLSTLITHTPGSKSKQFDKNQKILLKIKEIENLIE